MAMTKHMGAPAHGRGSTMALGPRPGLVLADDDALDLVTSTAHRFDSDIRKTLAWHRYLVWRGEYEGLVNGFIDKVIRSTGQRQEIKKYVTTINNIARDITLKTAMVWKQGAIRHVEGVDEDKSDALNELLNGARIDARAPTWNQRAFIEGPVIVLPVIRRLRDGALLKESEWRFGFDAIYPHFYDVKPDPLNPSGLPLAVAYTIDPDTRLQNGKYADADTILVDGGTFRYYKTTDRTRPELIAEVEHGVGRLPGAVFRTEEPDGDWFGGEQNQRLCDGTILAAFLEAKLGFVRKTQDRKQPVLSGNLDGVPGQMEQDPELPLTLHAESPEIVRFEALDFDTSPENTLRHISHFVHTLARAYGGRANIISDSGGLLVDIVFDYEEQTELRNAQIPFARDFERDLAEASVATMRAFDAASEWADKLPTAQEVRDGYRVELPPLSRQFSNPGEMRDHIDWELSKGFTDHADAFRKFNDPMMSKKDADERIMANVNSQIKIIDLLTKRNTSLDPINNAGEPIAQGNTTDLDEGPAERNGRLGGRASPGEGGEAEGEQAPVQEFDEAGEPIPMATVEAPDPNAADPGEAFNGAQVNALVELAKSVSLGELPYETAVQIAVVSYPINEARARKIMEPARTHKQPVTEDQSDNPNDEADASEE